MVFEDKATFYGRVEEKELKKALFQCSIKGFLGLILLFFGGLFFILGIFCIAWGFIPYKKIKELSENPPKLVVEETKLTLIQGKTEQTFPLQKIERIGYVDGEILLYSDQVITIPYFSKTTFKELHELLFDGSLHS